MGRTLIEHTLSSIKHSGITDVVIVVGENNEFEQILDPKELGVNIRYVVQKEPLGMGNALLCAKEQLDSSFFLINSYRLNFHEFKQDLEEKSEQGKTVTFLATPEDSLVEYGVLKMNGEKVVGIVEKPKKGEEPSNLRIVGIYLLTQDFLDKLKSTPVEQYQFEKALSDFVQDNPSNVVICNTPPFSLKYAWELLDVKDYLFKNLNFFVSESAVLGKNVVIEGDVFIGDYAKIFEGACIKGPAYIGDNAVVGNSTLIRNGSVLENGAKVGAFTEVKNSIVSENSSVHSGVVEDSVIGKNCRIGAKFCTANRRIDRGEISVTVKGAKVDTGRDFLGVIIGDDVRLGVNVNTMPGVIIGSSATVGPSTTVMENVDKNMLYYATLENIEKRDKS